MWGAKDASLRLPLEVRSWRRHCGSGMMEDENKRVGKKEGKKRVGQKAKGKMEAIVCPAMKDRGKNEADRLEGERRRTERERKSKKKMHQGNGR